MHCTRLSKQDNMTDDEAEDLVKNSILCKVACRILSRQKTVLESIDIASKNLKQDGFIHATGLTSAKYQTESSAGVVVPTTSLGKTLATIRSLMVKLDHRLHRGHVYSKATKG